MILSADELEVLGYLKSWKGKFVTLVEVCRCAGGRQKFRDNPNWARSFMTRLVESGQIAVNERGHYRWIGTEETADTIPSSPMPAGPSFSAGNTSATIIGDNYFPADSGSRWVSPQIASILQRSGKKIGHQPK